MHRGLVVIRDRLHHGADAFEGKWDVLLAIFVKVELLLPEGQPFGRVRYEPAAIDRARLQRFESPEDVRSARLTFRPVAPSPGTAGLLSHTREIQLGFDQLTVRCRRLDVSVEVVSVQHQGAFENRVVLD